MGIWPAAPAIILFSTLPTASGSSDLPCFLSKAFTASAGVGCLRASTAGTEPSGFGPNFACSSNTACICAFGFAASPSAAETAWAKPALATYIMPTVETPLKIFLIN